MAKTGGFTRTGRGYVRWYKGKTRWVGGLDLSPAQLDDAWQSIRRQIDAEAVTIDRRSPGEMTLGGLADAFFAAMRARRDTGKPRPLSARMFHNYETDVNHFGSFVGAGVRLRDIGPDHFARYARSLAGLKASGFDSRVAHVLTLMRWAVGMEYLDRVRFGSEFSRPAKREIRDDRIARRRGYTADEVARLLDAAGHTMRVMICLGVAGGLNNSEIASLGRDCLDLATGIIDFRRRKTGRVRRVIPLPDGIRRDILAYRRPDPTEPGPHGGLFFLTSAGLPYVRMMPGGQANTITVLFNRLATSCGVKAGADGRSFAGLRTTFVNLAPPGYRDEVELITGHAMGTILLDHYLEDVGLDRLRHVVDFVWGRVRTAARGLGPMPQWIAAD